MSLIHWINFDVLGDARGQLVAVESNRSVPFEVKRVYYVFGTKGGVARGFHAHKSTRQVAVAVSGSCRMLMDDGLEKESIALDSPNKGILIDCLQWHEMHDFSDDCVLLVFADDFYDESDYIRDYSEFLKRVSQ